MAEGDPHRTGQIVGKVEALVRGDVGRESRVERQARTRGSERRRIDDALGQFRSVEAQPAAELEPGAGAHCRGEFATLDPGLCRIGSIGEAVAGAAQGDLNLFPLYQIARAWCWERVVK